MSPEPPPSFNSDRDIPQERHKRGNHEGDLDHEPCGLDEVPVVRLVQPRVWEDQISEGKLEDEAPDEERSSTAPGRYS